MKIPTICDYCGGKVIFTDSAIVYGGRSYGNIYYCTNCGAYVGVHDGTRKPLGTLANAALRAKRREAHAAFDPLWKKRGMKRAQAYGWLAKNAPAGLPHPYRPVQHGPVPGRHRHLRKGI